MAVLDDFRRLLTVRDGKLKRRKSYLRTDKGHRGEWQAFADAIRLGKPSPTPFSEIVNSTLATLALARACSNHSWIDIETESVLTELHKQNEIVLSDKE